MQRKKKLFLISMTLILLLFVVVNVIKNNKYIKYNDMYTNNNQKIEMEYIDLSELEKSAAETITNLEKGRYSNLLADNLHVTLSDAKNVSKIFIHSRKEYRGLTEPLELMEEEVRVIKELLGENVNLDYMVDAACLYSVENEHPMYATYTELQQIMKNGEYKPNAPYTLPYMSYIAWTKDDKKDTRYAHVSHDFDEVVFMKGKLMELQGSKWEDPETKYEAFASYYVDDGNLNDEYRLLNGTISVKEAIDFVENYFNNELPYDKAPDVEEKVARVDIYEIDENVLCMEFTLRRKYNGLVFEYGALSGNFIPPYGFDSTRVIMVETDKIDERIGNGNGMLMEVEGKSVDKIVSLKSALDKVSGQIGKNSKYNVDLIEMIYRREEIQHDGFYWEYSGTPCWMIRCTNQADGKITTFYIELMSGAINYYTRPALIK